MQFILYVKRDVPTVFMCLSLVLQPDPTLERHFKGHRDSVTSVDISYNMKQIGNYFQSLFY